MVTSSSLEVHSETDEKKVYTVAVNGEIRYIRPTTVGIKFENNTILTTVTKHPHVVKEWIEGVNTNAGHRYVGFEVELDYATSRIGTAQFYVGNRCLVFQLGDEPRCPPSLEEFLSDHNKLTFVGTQVLWKMEQLRRQLSVRLIPRIGMKELGYYTTDVYLKKALVLGTLAMPGPDWIGTSKLAHEQVHYACLDAFLNIHIGKSLSLL